MGWKPSYWSNDNEKPDGTKGHPFWGWRAWWNGPEPECETRLSVDWYAGKKARHCGLEYSRDPSEQHQVLFIGIPYVFCLWLGVPWKSKGEDWRSRNYGVRIHSGQFWWEWHNTGDWSRDDPWWMSLNFDPMEFLFGSMKYTSTELETVDAVVPLPEKSVPVKVTRSYSTWKRSRLPWCSAKGHYAKVEVCEGHSADIPGKGENAWDCGDDYISSMSCKADTVEDAIGKFTASVLRTRKKYGGSYDFKASE